MTVTIHESRFGKLDDGTDVMGYLLDNGAGLALSVCNLGGIITSLSCPDRNGNPGDVVLGFDEPQAYLRSPYIGALIGRYCNRIANGRFSLDGKTYHLPVNDNGHQLHGGPRGFDKRLWQADTREENADNVLVLTLVSPDGDQGFPGTLRAKAVFRLTRDNALHIQLSATCDQATHVNLTHHGYFNLRGRGDILRHELTIHADAFTPVDDTLIPTGEVLPVAGTALDFRRAKAIGEHIRSREAQLVPARGYDHNFVLNTQDRAALTPAAQVHEPESGRVMLLSTTEPGLQFYSGNFLDGTMTGKGRVLSPQAAFCLEPQHFPDTPNRPGFPSTVLRPGETYRSESVYRFSTDS